MKRRWFGGHMDDDLIAAARKEGQLTVMGMPRDWCGYGALIDAFEAKYGLAVTELQPDATSAGQLDAIRAGQRDAALPSPDVIDVGESFGPAAKRQGLLQPYRVAKWSSIPDSAKDAHGFWYGYYSGVLAFEINADIIKDPPKDWPDLLAPRCRNAIALAGTPFASQQAILSVYAAGLSAGGSREDGAGEGLKFFGELVKRGNFAPVVGDACSLASGTTPILIRWDCLALGDRDRFAGAPKIEVVVPKTGLVGGLYVQAISAGAAHPSAARLWMEYLYSDEAQLTWLFNSGHPIRIEDLVRTGKVPAALAERLPEIKEREPTEPVFPTPEEQERARETIINGWDAVVGVKFQCTPPPRPRPPMSLNDTPRQASMLPAE